MHILILDGLSVRHPVDSVSVSKTVQVAVLNQMGANKLAKTITETSDTRWNALVKEATSIQHSQHTTRVFLTYCVGGGAELSCRLSVTHKISLALWRYSLNYNRVLASTTTANRDRKLQSRTLKGH